MNNRGLTYGVAFGALVGLGASAHQLRSARAPEGHDWTQFGWDLARSSASTAATGINAANVSTMQRQQVSIDGTIDASVIYLAGIRVGGAEHDVFFGTTT
jgi:hypothetical protein